MDTLKMCSGLVCPVEMCPVLAWVWTAAPGGWSCGVSRAWCQGLPVLWLPATPCLPKDRCQRFDKPPMHICTVKSLCLFLSFCAQQCRPCAEPSGPFPAIDTAPNIPWHRKRLVLLKAASSAPFYWSVQWVGDIFGQPTVHSWLARQK